MASEGPEALAGPSGFRLATENDGPVSSPVPSTPNREVEEVQKYNRKASEGAPEHSRGGSPMIQDYESPNYSFRGERAAVPAIRISEDNNTSNSNLVQDFSGLNFNLEFSLETNSELTAREEFGRRRVSENVNEESEDPCSRNEELYDDPPVNRLDYSPSMSQETLNRDTPSFDGTSFSALRSNSAEVPPYDYENTPSLFYTSPSPERPQMYRIRTQDAVTPRWQPDAEVTICPICRTQFSFFVRKHHCRKCGRVVCNACSPHRITIPYQFIVQPPTIEGFSPNPLVRPSANPTPAGSSSDVATLGGGERVRLCNPCVPDPNTTPPQVPTRELSRQHAIRNSHGRSRSSVTAASASNFRSSGGHSMTNPLHPPDGLTVNYANWRQQTRPENINAAGRPSSTSIVPTRADIQSSSLRNRELAFESQRGESRSRSTTVTGSEPLASAEPRVNLRTPRAVSGIYQRPHHDSSRSRDDNLQQRPLPRTPQIAEEDECPICHEELPSSALPDAEHLRELHISTCIENVLGRGSEASPSQGTSANSPSQPSSQVLPQGAASSTITISAPIANTPEARTAAREQAHAAVVLGRSSPTTSNFRRTGVFPYKATEKDCVDDAECTICLEEFVVGNDMGRLECFCRFHLHCIRGWFVHHYGQCPVHQHGF